MDLFSSNSDFNFVNALLFPREGQSYSPSHRVYGNKLIWLQNSTGLNFPNLWLPKNSNGVIMYCHGNGGTLKDWYSLMKTYSERFHISVFAIEYPGYGPAEGFPSESTVNDNAKTAYTFLTGLGYPTDNIILMGYSIGTGPTLRLASELCTADPPSPPGGVITVAAFSSIIDIVQDLKGMHVINVMAPMILAERWDSASNIRGVSCPVLLIHGSQDLLIPWEHSRKLFENCPSEHKQLHLCPQADHCRFSEPSDTLDPIRTFLQSHFKPSLKGIIELHSTFFKCPSSVLATEKQQQDALRKARSTPNSFDVNLECSSTPCLSLTDLSSWVDGLSSLFVPPTPSPSPSSSLSPDSSSSPNRNSSSPPPPSSSSSPSSSSYSSSVPSTNTLYISTQSSSPSPPNPPPSVSFSSSLSSRISSSLSSSSSAVDRKQTFLDSSPPSFPPPSFNSQLSSSPSSSSDHSPSPSGRSSVAGFEVEREDSPPYLSSTRTVGQFFEALNRHDVECMVSLLDEGVSALFPNSELNWYRREGARARFSHLFDLNPHLRVDFEVVDIKHKTYTTALTLKVSYLHVSPPFPTPASSSSSPLLSPSSSSILSSSCPEQVYSKMEVLVHDERIIMLAHFVSL